MSLFFIINVFSFLGVSSLLPLGTLNLYCPSAALTLYLIMGQVRSNINRFNWIQEIIQIKYNFIYTAQYHTKPPGTLQAEHQQHHVCDFSVSEDQMFLWDVCTGRGVWWLNGEMLNMRILDHTWFSWSVSCAWAVNSRWAEARKELRRREKERQEGSGEEQRSKAGSCWWRRW